MGPATVPEAVVLVDGAAVVVVEARGVGQEDLVAQLPWDSFGRVRHLMSSLLQRVNNSSTVTGSVGTTIRSSFSL